MGNLLNKKTLAHLAELARLELKAEEEEKLLKDLGKILDHFRELQELGTEGVTPTSGGTALVNVFREDEERVNTNRGAGVDAFPETDKKFLRVPPVFSSEGGSASGRE